MSNITVTGFTLAGLPTLTGWAARLLTWIFIFYKIFKKILKILKFSNVNNVFLLPWPDHLCLQLPRHGGSFLKLFATLLAFRHWLLATLPFSGNQTIFHNHIANATTTPIWNWPALAKKGVFASRNCNFLASSVDSIFSRRQDHKHFWLLSGSQDAKNSKRVRRTWFARPAAFSGWRRSFDRRLQMQILKLM